MKTQVVYAVISSDNDCFLEEMWVSAWSLRHYNPDVKIVVLADESTAKRIEDNRHLRALINQIKLVEVSKNDTPIRKSRVIKTNIRNLINGDYLFLDTDTVVCAPLDEIDSYDCEIACVVDTNVPIANNIFGQSIIDNIKSLYGMDIGDYPFYFNSGVMLVKDNERTREFYKEWNKNWQYSSAYKYSQCQDQPAMLKTDIDMGRIIHRLPDVYNAQVTYGIKYLHEAKIVHFVNMNWIKDRSFSPFIGKAIYKQLKQEQAVTVQMQNTILNCKSAYKDHSIVVGRSYAEFLYSTFCIAFMDKYLASPSFRTLLNRLGAYYIRWQRTKKKIFKQ